MPLKNECVLNLHDMYKLKASWNKSAFNCLNGGKKSLTAVAYSVIQFDHY
jgi:hypothetical protein